MDSQASVALSLEARKKENSFCCLASSIHSGWYKLLLQRVCCCFGLQWFWVQQVSPIRLHWDLFSAVIITGPLSLFDIFYTAHSYSPACMSFLLFARWMQLLAIFQVEKMELLLKTVMEHPQVETGPESGWWHRAFNLLNVSGLMAIQRDWWLPASCYCCGWKGCLPLEEGMLSWVTGRAISDDLLIIFFQKTLQLLRSICSWGKNICMCFFAYLLQIGQTWGYTWKRALS